jgi:hypothetical protein
MEGIEEEAESRCSGREVGVNDKVLTILVIAIGHRRDIYKKIQ